jgi:hypothetical protein
MTEMIKIESTLVSACDSGNQYLAGLAQSCYSAFQRKMRDVNRSFNGCLMLYRCSSFLDPAICGLLKSVLQSQANNNWGTYEEVFSEKY